MAKRGRPKGSWDAAFIVALVERRGNLRVAAELVGVHRNAVYYRMRADESFRSRVLDAIRSPKIDARRRALLEAAAAMARAAAAP